MAKYGNFVGREGLNFTTEEVEMFKNHVISEFNKVKMPFDFTFGGIEVTEKNVKYKYSGGAIRITFCLENEIKIRNIVGDRITAKSILFVFHKDRGELEEIDGNGNRTFHTPMECYSCNVLVQGSFIKYRCRNVENISVKECYHYGTECSDFDFSKALRDIRTTLTPLW